MSVTLFMSADFGPGKAGLTTVGWTPTGGTRTTTGVAEIGHLTGVYGSLITFPDGFKGAILWDTGEVAPAYASEDVNVAAPSPTAPAQCCPATPCEGTAGSALAEAVENPRRVSGDAGSVEGHSLPDLIAADKYLNAKKAAGTRSMGLRFTKLIPDGTAGRSHRGDGEFGGRRF